MKYRKPFQDRPYSDNALTTKEREEDAEWRRDEDLENERAAAGEQAAVADLRIALAAPAEEAPLTLDLDRDEEESFGPGNPAEYGDR